MPCRFDGELDLGCGIEGRDRFQGPSISQTCDFLSSRLFCPAFDASSKPACAKRVTTFKIRLTCHKETTLIRGLLNAVFLLDIRRQADAVGQCEAAIKEAKSANLDLRRYPR